MATETQNPEHPRLNVTAATVAGAVVGAGLLAAVGAGAGFTLDALSDKLPASFPQFSPLSGALGGAAVGTAIGGLNGFANAQRINRESELLPPPGRRESWQERVIKQRALATARVMEAGKGENGPAVA